MIKKFFKLIKIISFISICVAFVAFIFERLDEKKYKNYKRHKPYGLYEQYIKRPIDVFLSTGALIVFSPILLVTALLVRFKLGSPILFTQNRPGRIDPCTNQPKIFKLFKFRTMTDKRDADGNLLPDSERLTPFGKKLRLTSLDELPELFNVIIGDMSLIGPRPLLVQYLPYYTDVEQHRHDVRPGLSGLAQVNGRNLVKWNQRLAYDVRYVNRITFWDDIKIILLTIKKVLIKENVAADTESVDEGYLDQIRGNGLNE